MKQSLFSQRMKLKKEIPQQQETGFPQTFKVDVTPKQTRAQFHGLSESEYEKINDENLKALKEMSEEQVKQLQQQIYESLGDGLCKMFQSGDIYQKSQQKQMQIEINQNISKNKEIFNQFIDEDQIVISQIQELIKSAEMSCVKQALQKIEPVIKLKNVLYLEQINISEYLISVGKSTNLSVSIMAFDLLYNYWQILVPNCWNPIFNINQTNQIQELFLDLPQMLNQLQYCVEYTKVLDLLRIRNILCQTNTKYVIEQKQLLNLECKIKSIILLNQFELFKEQDFNTQLSDFILQMIYYYNNHLQDSQCNIIISQASKLQTSNIKLALFYQYQNRFNCKIIHEDFNLNIKKPQIPSDITIYEIIPVYTLIQDLYDSFNFSLFQGKSLVKCLKEIVSLIFDIRLQAKFIISRKQRKQHKWRILNTIRSTFQELFKNEANKRTSIKENNEKFQLLELIRQQLKIEFHLQNEQELVFEASLYTGLFQFLRQHEYELKFVQEFVDKFSEIDFEIKPEFILLKLYKLLISDKTLPQGLLKLYSFYLSKINILEFAELLNKNVSYFEKLLQKCQYDSFFEEIYVNTLFLFISPYFNADFHNLLFQEFQNTPILQKLRSDIYKDHLNLFTKKPNKGSELYRLNVLDIMENNEFIIQWKKKISQW